MSEIVGTFRIGGEDDHVSAELIDKNGKTLIKFRVRLKDKGKIDVDVENFDILDIVDIVKEVAEILKKYK